VFSKYIIRNCNNFLKTGVRYDRTSASGDFLRGLLYQIGHLISMKKILLFVLSCSFLQLKSQTQLPPTTPAAFNMGGGSAVITPTFIVDWSIGESTVTETFYGENAFANSITGVRWNVTSGILQPYDTTHIVYNFLVPTFTNQEIHFYPVPTPGTVFIEFRSVTTGKISIQLFNRDGQLLGVKEFFHNNSSSTQSWDLSNCLSGAYFFRIFLSNAQGAILKQGTFTIEKIK
jgi:hypothetical protein